MTGHVIASQTAFLRNPLFQRAAKAYSAGVLPIVAIAELATKASSVVNEFCREYREAPKEVQHFAEQLGLIQSTFDSISQLA
jgi:hypothetical protein